MTSLWRSYSESRPVLFPLYKHVKDVNLTWHSLYGEGTQIKVIEWKFTHADMAVVCTGEQADGIGTDHKKLPYRTAEGPTRMYLYLSKAVNHITQIIEQIVSSNITSIIQTSSYL